MAQTAGLLYQRIVGQPVETAIVLKHVTDLAGQGLLERDDSGFRWRMTALIGNPTLRLMRVQIGEFQLGNLTPGTWRDVTSQERKLIFA